MLKWETVMGVTNAEFDALVLEALREIASCGTKASINGKAVQEATPQGDQCVYGRVADELEKRVEVRYLMSFHPLIQFKILVESMERLTRQDLIFNDGRQVIEERIFWVVMG